MKKTLSIILAFSLIPGDALAAAITSATAGPWSSTSTWTGGVVPGNGDTATLAHAVAATASLIVGNSPNTGGTAAIQINNGGQLTCNTPGVDVTVRGDLKYANPSVARNVIDFTSSCILSMDNTQSSDPTTVQYTIGPSATNATNALLNFQGVSNTDGNRAVIRSLRPNGNELQANFGVNGFTTQLNRIDFRNFQLLDMGNASVNAITSYTPSMFRMRDGLVTRSGLVSTGATTMSATSVFHIENVTWENSTGKNLYFTSTIDLAGGTRLVKGNYFDAPYMTGMGTLGWTFQDNVVASTPGSWFSGNVALSDNNLFIHAGSLTFPCNGTLWSNNYFFNTNGAANGKFCQVTQTSSVTTFQETPRSS